MRYTNCLLKYIPRMDNNPKLARTFGQAMNKFLIILLIAAACSQPTPDAQRLVDESIEAHGANLQGKTAEFDFREKHYTVSRGKHAFTYTRLWQDDSLGFVEDILVNSARFTRKINGDTVPVTDEWVEKYTSSVNSVLYFFQVPYVLNDRGAIKNYDGDYIIKNEPYDCVRVTFSEDGGGEDHEDVFLYWIHKERKTVDFFAYSYLTEGGGVRFREAINRRKIEGFVVQDYINYEAEKGTALNALPGLFEEGKLRELSRIENTNVSIRTN